MLSQEQTKNVEKYIRTTLLLILEKLFRYQSGVFVILLLVVLGLGLWMWKDFYRELESNNESIEKRIGEMEDIVFNEAEYVQMTQKLQERSGRFTTEKEFAQVFIPLPEDLRKEE
jgi:hypothetical protein